jgi:starch-binding outer membrane protein, SusD/RagB family
LYMGNWEKSIEAATNVLNRKSDLMNLNTWGGADQNNKPIVGTQNQEVVWVYGSPHEAVFSTGQQTEAHQYTLSNELLSSYETGDLRASIYIKNKRSMKRPLVAVAKVAQAFRISEALLNRAEAHAQLNKLGQTQHAQLALNDLNTLRKKRFTPDSYHDLVSTDADDLLQKCYEEKRREFFGEECHRWFDLRRHGMPSIAHFYRESNTLTLKYVLEDHDPAYVLQIPKGVLEKNTKLTPNPDPAPRIGH